MVNNKVMYMYYGPAVCSSVRVCTNTEEKALNSKLVTVCSSRTVSPLQCNLDKGVINGGINIYSLVLGCVQ